MRSGNAKDLPNITSQQHDGRVDFYKDEDIGSDELYYYSDDEVDLSEEIKTPTERVPQKNSCEVVSYVDYCTSYGGSDGTFGES